jgi:hypothetical protein
MSKPPTVFFDNDRVEPADLVAGQRAACVERIKAEGATVVLLVQDTTAFDFSQHPQTNGMGPLENEHRSGFWAHSTLAVSAAGVPLGVWDQQVWVRDAATTGKRHQRHEREFVDKESYKWVTGLPEMEAATSVTQVVTVCDREAHIFEFFEGVLDQGADFVVRASRGRSFTEDGQTLFAEVAEWPVQQHYALTVKRRPDREARQAQVVLRFGSLDLKVPRRVTTSRQTLQIQVVEVLEPAPPDGHEAVHWVLLTSLPVTTLEQAHQVVQWYTYRWLIERFHYVLKSGCKLEERQLQTEARLERLLAVFNLIAWRLLWLTYQARQTPDVSCLAVFTEPEWQALYQHHHRTTHLPHTPPTLAEVVRMIAQLGGFLGRAGDGEPGVKVLWRGWMRLQDKLDTWLIFHSPPQQDVGNA